MSFPPEQITFFAFILVGLSSSIPVILFLFEPHHYTKESFFEELIDSLLDKDIAESNLGLALAFEQQRLVQSSEAEF